jgi:electron transfer flavoprotein alpha subunit
LPTGFIAAGIVKDGKLTETVRSKIWVFVEQRHGQPAEVGRELVGKALELAHPMGWNVAVVLIGHRLSASHRDGSTIFGADELLIADHPLLESYCSQTYTKVLEEAIRRHQPEVFLLGATAMGTDLGARLAARLRIGLSAHCIDLQFSSLRKLLAVVPGWGGNVLATIHCPESKPQMATVMPGVFERKERKNDHGKVILLEVAVKPEDVTYQILETKRGKAEESPLERAEVIVAGGWGIGSKEDWHWIEDLASSLKGAVGATRQPVDEGWAKEHQMIGQSGRTVHPRLYLGVAISGVMHHMVGIKNAEVMVAINQDPKAAIFDFCDLGLVGDYREIVPSLIKAIQGYRQGG